jgi:hypothetical protein
MRTTKTELRQTVKVLQNAGIDIDIHWAYGQPRCTTCDGGRDLSPRLTMREMKWWLHGFECGHNAAHVRDYATWRKCFLADNAPFGRSTNSPYTGLRKEGKENE